MKYLSALLCLSLSSIANAETSKKIPVAASTQIAYKIIAERSHKPSLFTEGLVINNGYFYESSGLYAKSLLVSYPVSEPESIWAKISAPFSQRKPLVDGYFAEGLTLLNKKLYQLTWKEGTLFVVDASTFSLLGTMKYEGEGWGLTTDSKQFIRSDGSANLFFHNINTFALERKISVHINDMPLANLNELEYAKGFIWANIWHDMRIVKINPADGEVVGIVDLSTLAAALNLRDPESVLNGIAYDEDKNAFWVTGKQWPKMFLVKIYE